MARRQRLRARQQAAAEQPPKETFRAMSPAEFFHRHKEIAGFDNPTKAFYQAIRELVENALDATDVYGILPDIFISVEAVDKANMIYRITVEDNGIGIPPNNVPYAFGSVFYSSKYKLRQSRGRFGLGAKAVVIHAQSSTGQPLEVYTAPIGSKRIYYFKIRIELGQNKPSILERGEFENPTGWHGTRVSIVFKGDWSRARHRILTYLERTAIAAPYANIVFVDPDGNVIVYKRKISRMPPPPKEVKPHPHGIDVETLKELIRRSNAKTMLEFMVETFQGVGKKTALAFLEYAGIPPETDPHKLSSEDIAKLVDKMKEFKKFRPPSAEALSPLGREIIETGLRAVLQPEFVTAVTRRPRVYEGHPFIVEVGLAYGGKIPPQEEPMLLRYANKIPLLYDEKADVAWKVVSQFDWRNYMVTFPAPLAVLVHIASTKVPYKALGKESVAEVPEIEQEIRNALREAARRLRQYLLEKKREEEARKRVVTYMKYIPEVAKSLAVILKDYGVKESDVREMLLTAMKKRLRLPDEEFAKLIEGLEVSVEE